MVHAFRDNSEPRVEEMLRDPIVLQLMRSDNVSPDIIDRLQQQTGALSELLASLKRQ